MKKRKLSILIYGSTILIIVGFIIIKYYKTFKTDKYEPIVPELIHKKGQGFAGSETCASCHPKIYRSHHETAHFKTSRLADSATVKGNFNIDNNFILNDEIRFSMVSEKEGVFQNTFLMPIDSLIESKRLDLAIGSGTKGQSYFNWQDEELYQLQVSYFEPDGSWVNSPGYPNRTYAPNRPVRARCLECHFTYAENKQTFNRPNVYKKSNLILGVDCERCHGPSIAHVNYHNKHPNESAGRKILSFSTASQQQNLDMCALCHSGTSIDYGKSPFEFIAGDTLTHKKKEYEKLTAQDSLDVHGNQYGLLVASPCFKNSTAMSCTSCHDSHKNQRNNHEWFNSKCIDCHQNSTKNIDCSQSMEKRKSAENNCIKCHMPLTPSKTMSVFNQEDSLVVPVYIRTHLIGIYD